MQASSKINNTVKEANFFNNGVSEVGFGSFDDEEDAEHNGVSLEDIPEIPCSLEEHYLTMSPSRN